MAKIGNVGVSSDLSSAEIGSGLFVYCTDTGELYVDYENAGKKARGQVKMAGSAYVSGVTISGGNLKVTKGDGSSTNVPIGNYAGSSSNGGAANSVKSSMVIKLNGGTTEGTNQFTYNGSAGKSLNITPASIGAAASSHSQAISTITGLQDALDAKLGSTATAAAASKLATARTITLAGDVTGSVSFDGSKNVSITTAVTDNSHAHTIDNVTGLQDALDGKLATAGTAAAATKLATARAITLAGDASGTVDFDGTEDVSLTVTVKDDSHSHTIANVDGLQTALNGKLATTGTAAAASKLATARTISLTGDATGSVEFDGTDDVSIAVTVADDSHNHTIANVDGLQTALNGKLGTSATAAAATKLATGRTFSITGGATAAGVTFNGTGNVALNVTSLDATKLNGIVPIANLPAGALERLVPVEDQAARFALTSSEVQLGDTVQQLDTGVMYLVVNTAELDNAAGYKEYTAGSATSVPWSGVTGKPSSFTPSTHTHSIAQVTNLQTTLDGKLGKTATAAAATKLATARAITLAGDVSGTVDFDGTEDVSITVAVKDDSHAHTIANVDGLQSALNGKLATTGTAAAASKLATARTISLTGDATGSVEFDGSDDVAITVSVADDSHNHTIANVDGLQTALDGKLATTGTAAAASKLATARTITLSGDVTGSVSFDGSKNVTITTDVPAMRGATSSAAGAAGLVPAPTAGSANKYLRNDGTWATPPDTNTTYSNMGGSSTSAAGRAGLVPAPAKGANNRYLRCDGTWSVPPDTNTTYSLSSFGISATAAELNKLDGVTVGATQFNYLSGVTSNIQTQLNNLSSRITTAQNTANTANTKATNAQNTANTALSNANAAKSVTDKYSAMLNIIGNGQ